MRRVHSDRQEPRHECTHYRLLESLATRAVSNDQLQRLRLLAVIVSSVRGSAWLSTWLEGLFSQSLGPLVARKTRAVGRDRRIDGVAARRGLAFKHSRVPAIHYHETTTARRKALKSPEIPCNILQCRPTVVTCWSVRFSCRRSVVRNLHHTHEVAGSSPASPTDWSHTALRRASSSASFWRNAFRSSEGSVFRATP
jgi:hypothetical protein